MSPGLRCNLIPEFTWRSPCSSVYHSWDEPLPQQSYLWLQQGHAAVPGGASQVLWDGKGIFIDLSLTFCCPLVWLVTWPACGCHMCDSLLTDCWETEKCSPSVCDNVKTSASPLPLQKKRQTSSNSSSVLAQAWILLPPLNLNFTSPYCTSCSSLLVSTSLGFFALNR